MPLLYGARMLLLLFLFDCRPLRPAWCVRDEKQQHVFASTRASVADNSTPHAVLLSRFFTHSTCLRITRCVHYTPLTQRVKVEHGTI